MPNESNIYWKVYLLLNAVRRIHETLMIIIKYLNVHSPPKGLFKAHLYEHTLNPDILHDWHVRLVSNMNIKLDVIDISPFSLYNNLHDLNIVHLCSFVHTCLVYYVCSFSLVEAIHKYIGEGSNKLLLPNQSTCNVLCVCWMYAPYKINMFKPNKYINSEFKWRHVYF